MKKKAYVVQNIIQNVGTDIGKRLIKQMDSLLLQGQALSDREIQSIIAKYVADQVLNLKDEISKKDKNLAILGARELAWKTFREGWVPATPRNFTLAETSKVDEIVMQAQETALKGMVKYPELARNADVIFHDFAEPLIRALTLPKDLDRLFKAEVYKKLKSL